MFFRVVSSLSSGRKKYFFFLGIYITDGKSMLAFSNEASVRFVRRMNSINFYLHCKDCSYLVPKFLLVLFWNNLFHQVGPETAQLCYVSLCVGRSMLEVMWMMKSDIGILQCIVYMFTPVIYILGAISCQHPRENLTVDMTV